MRRRGRAHAAIALAASLSLSCQDVGRVPPGAAPPGGGGGALGDGAGDGAGDAGSDAGHGPPGGGRPVEADPGGPDQPADGGRQAPPDPGTYGAPCDSADDCGSGVCVPDGAAGVCSQRCLTECPDLYPARAAFCRSDPSRSEDVSFVCYPEQDLSCAPCLDDSQCDGGRCIDTADGRICARQCDAGGGAGPPCREGFGCVERLCLPLSGSCTCTPLTEGRTRVCARQNAHGRCTGLETCDPGQGWTGCTAPEAQPEVCDGVDDNCNGVPDDGVVAQECQVEGEHGVCAGTAVCQGPDGVECLGRQAEAEVCDGVDNDCDGLVDEGFTDEAGHYGLFAHCGGCNRTCEGRFSFADEVACDGDRLPPACVITRCAPGYHRVGDALCAPLSDVTCNPCNADADCAAVSPGAACLSLGDPAQPETLQRVCGRDCSAAGAYGRECADGFVCLDTVSAAGRPVEQCAPEGGTCACRDNPAGFSVPCRIENVDDPGLPCEGRRGCVGDAFGPCVPPAEVCDGLDNDCNGVIDDGARDPATGRYSLDPVHCGRCNRDCALVEFRNAEGLCDPGQETPACAMRCRDGFADLDNGPDDGCECRVAGAEDLPDDEGLDADCDGIDGQRDRGVFVSKRGRPEGVGDLDDPVDSIGAALALAAGRGLRDVYVATGVYSENVELAAGVGVYGGYSLDFRARDPAVQQTTLLGVANAAGIAAAVVARGIRQPTRLDGFSIYGPSAAAFGRSSFGIYVVDSDGALQITRNEVFAGNGGDGGRGATGVAGPDGRDGARGRAAITSNNAGCGLAPRVGGVGGALECAGVNVSGGDGGEAHCPISQRNNGAQPCRPGQGDCRNDCPAAPCAAEPPPQGRGGAGRGPAGGAAGAATYDRWSNTGICGQCGLFTGLERTGVDGNAGADGAAGTAGKGCTNVTGAFDAEGDWQSGAGGNGADGVHGSGGGGGSAGSGYDTVPGAVGLCADNLGGSGGGGGSGGCRGTAGGAGSGGGGSFAVLVRLTRPRIASLPELRGNTLHPGAGGDGANGGVGGTGGLGGVGGTGGQSVSQDAFCTEPGGRGGLGGDGGAGGGGGGGCGGASAGIYVDRGPNGRLDGVGAFGAPVNTFAGGGRGGRGGAGGGSLGNPGEAGQEGRVADVLQRGDDDL